MFFSNLFLPTLREAPSDADIISSKLMLRAGLIRKLSSGIYEWLPLGLKILKKVEKIIREEMNAKGGQEVLLPIIQPKELWEETGRWNLYGKELFRLKDRKNSEFCLGPTHEEVITDLVRKDIRSYRQLPIMLYQFGTKFRDEIRPRFGIMRAREFVMKDAYSFHANEDDAAAYYQKMYEAYNLICQRCGFKFRAVEAQSGNIGGSYSHEFMVLAETGEEEIAWCNCGYASNTEKTPASKDVLAGNNRDIRPAERVHTPSMKSVKEVSDYLKRTPENFIKTLIYTADSKPVIVLVRGDHEINEAKLKNVLECTELVLATPDMIEAVTGAPVGFAGPVNFAQNGTRIAADFSVENIVNAVSGANLKDYHLVNINIGTDYAPDILADIRKVKKGDSCPKCKAELNFSRGIEIGHTFKLGLKYSKSMNAVYLDDKGKENLMVMGCYGIGVSRILAAAIEQSHDVDGIVWPQEIAPFDAVIIPTNWSDEHSRQVALNLYNSLTQNGFDILLDDRDERAGVKFKDADLLGIPLKITVGEKNLKNNKLEIKKRSKNSQTELVDIDKAIELIVNIISKRS